MTRNSYSIPIRKKPLKKKEALHKKNSSLLVNSSERRLITVNQTKIRKKVLNECQKTLKKIDKTKKELEQFESVDRPAYDRWLQQNFGEQLDKIRTSSIEIHQKRSLIEEVQDEAFRQGITFPQAYKIVKKRKESSENIEQKEEKKAEEEHFWENKYEDEEDIFREDLNDFYKKFHEKFKMNEEDFDSIRKGLGLGSKDKSSDLDTRLKERYRIIVQRLHPDKNRDASEMEKELWHEAQEAYKHRDLEKLDFIITMVNIQFGSAGIDSSVFDLKAANAKLQKKLKQFASSIKKAKKEPSWGFLLLKPMKLSVLKKEIEVEVRDYSRIVQTELKEINAILLKWETNDIEPKRQPNRRNSIEENFYDFYLNF